MELCPKVWKELVQLEAEAATASDVAYKCWNPYTKETLAKRDQMAKEFLLERDSHCRYL